MPGTEGRSALGTEVLRVSGTAVLRVSGTEKTKTCPVLRSSMCPVLKYRTAGVGGSGPRHGDPARVGGGQDMEPPGALAARSPLLLLLLLRPRAAAWNA
eukprot:3474687-Rhodomonas_salina.1